MRAYHELLALAQAQPQGADFHSLRMAYARSDAYNPYGGDVQSVERLRQALRAAEIDAALETASTLLAANYLDVEAHMAADYVYTSRHDAARAAYHRAFAKGLIDAILRTGDGQTYDRAYIVLSVSEEYLVLRMRGLRTGTQAMVQHEGHWYDVLTAHHSQGEGTQRVYFNIDFIQDWADERRSG